MEWQCWYVLGYLFIGALFMIAMMRAKPELGQTSSKETGVILGLLWPILLPVALIYFLVRFLRGK